MRIIRIAVSFLFVLSCVIFVLYYVQVRMVQDTVPPQIESELDEIQVSVEATEQELIQGLTAWDERDGDLTSSIRVSSISHFISQGKRMVSYVVFDKANQAAIYERPLTYTDYTAPRIYLSEPLRFDKRDVFDVDLMEYVTAQDSLDGDITSQVRMVQKDLIIDGYEDIYEIALQVSNSAGDVCTIPMELETVDNSSREEISKYYPALSEYIVYTKVGEKLQPTDYLTGVINSGVEYSFTEDYIYLDMGRNDVKIQSNVDYDTPGVYTVEYSYTSADNAKAVTKLYVVVEE